jgi:hypothetical protein
LRAAPAPTPASGYYRGPIGSGYASALVWRFSVRVAGDSGSWVAHVDAHSGAVRSFVDDNKYARIKGGVYPLRGDQVCPDGCEQPNYPLPFATVNINASHPTTNSMGVFNCSPTGATATTTLSGPFVKIVDLCGAISESVTCSADLDLGVVVGLMAVPAGASPGNTHAGPTSFFHVNRIGEDAVRAAGRLVVDDAAHGASQQLRLLFGRVASESAIYLGPSGTAQKYGRDRA